MARKNRTTPDKRRWEGYLIVGMLLMIGVTFLSGWRAMRTAEERFCQTLEFVKSQSTSFEKYNDTITAKALRRTAVAVHQLAEDPALDLSDPQCLKKEAERKAKEPELTFEKVAKPELPKNYHSTASQWCSPAKKSHQLLIALAARFKCD